MTEKRASLEVIAPTVEEAVAKGLEDLGLPQEGVDVEVLDPGSRGLFGLGSRHARVRLTIKSFEAEEPAPIRHSTNNAARQEEPEPQIIETAPPASAVSPPAAWEATAVEKPAKTVEPATTREAAPQGDEEALRVARETVQELLQKMNLRSQVSVSAEYGVAEDDRSKAPLIVNVRGDDLSILIGPRADTLNALQYIASLMISKELGHSAPLIVDVEGYRSRREQQIRQLARRMAEQAIKTGRRQVLEPMPANERRIIHIELRNHPQVFTESIGEEPRRKVTINPK